MEEIAKPENAPLSVSVEDGQLVIRIGVDTNAWAFEHSDENNPFNDGKNDYVQTSRVTDSTGFARDVARAMQDEEEDGSSPLTDFIDRMFTAAVNDGSMAVEDDMSGTSAYEKDGR
jgi:hypothetical protein